MKPQQNIWFTSDTHGYHCNICRGTSTWGKQSKGYRDFDTIEEMNQTILDGINNKVKKDDILYHLGDFVLGGTGKIIDFRQRINCKNVHLILGNHDDNQSSNTIPYFSSVQDYKIIKIEKQELVLFHYPIASWYRKDKFYPSIHLHGHLHGNDHHKNNYPKTGKILDVGIDNYYKLFGSYEPFSYEEIQSILK